jgi:hypothetical protein
VVKPPAAAAAYVLSEQDLAIRPVLSNLPQLGQVLAYRVLEVGSSWCPQVGGAGMGLSGRGVGRQHRSVAKAITTAEG